MIVKDKGEKIPEGIFQFGPILKKRETNSITKRFQPKVKPVGENKGGKISEGIFHFAQFSNKITFPTGFTLG